MEEDKVAVIRKWCVVKIYLIQKMDKNFTIFLICFRRINDTNFLKIILCLEKCVLTNIQSILRRFLWTNAQSSRFKSFFHWFFLNYITHFALKTVEDFSRHTKANTRVRETIKKQLNFLWKIFIKKIELFYALIMIFINFSLLLSSILTLYFFLFH